MFGNNRLITYLKKYSNQIYLSIAANLVLSVFTVISIPIIIPFFQLLFDRIPDKKADGLEGWLNENFLLLIDSYGKNGALVLVCCLIIVVFFLKNLSRYLALYFITPLRNGIVRDLRSDLFQKFIALPLTYYRDEKKGDLMSRATIDVQEVEWSILNVIESVFKAPIIIAGCLIFMFYISVKLSLFVFALLFFTAVIIGSISKSLRKSSEEVQSTLGKITTTIDESLTGLRIVKAYTAENFQQKKFNADNESYFKILNKVLWRKDLASPLSEFLGVSVVAVLLWYGTTLVFKNELSPETFFAFVFAFYQIIEPSKYFASAIYNIQKGRAAMARVNQILDVAIDNRDREDAIQMKDFASNITFKNVSFKYDESSDYALKNINVIIQKGEKIALVGPSGSGKSTMMDLLLRFVECSEGLISIDEKDILGFTIKSLREKFGVVSQEAFLFNDTVANNIAFGEFSIDEEALEKAGKAANAHDFIMDTQLQYNTSVGEKGSRFSGGQKQRITIARAIYKNPPIMILDEATSSLDSESELIVQKALDHIMQNRTSIVIAHRLSTIKNVDRIIVLNNGMIDSIGKHEDLLNTSELYRKLVESQNMYV